MEQTINYVKMAAYIGAAIAMGVGAIGPALSQGLVGSKACESMGKYPESSNTIRTTAFLILGIVETSAIYAFIIALMLILFSGN